MIDTDALLGNRKITPLLRLTLSTQGDAHSVHLAFEGDGLVRQTANATFSFALTPQDDGDLRWYLEDYLEWPHDPAPQIAARIEAWMMTEKTAVLIEKEPSPVLRQPATHCVSQALREAGAPPGRVPRSRSAPTAHDRGTPRARIHREGWHSGWVERLRRSRSLESPPGILQTAQWTCRFS